MSVGLMDPPGIAMAAEKAKMLSIKLASDVVEAARIVSAYRNEPMAEMLSEILRPALARMEREEVAKRSTIAPDPKRKGGAK